MANALPMMNMGAAAGGLGGASHMVQGQQMPVGLAGLFGLLVGSGEGVGLAESGLVANMPFMPVKQTSVLPASAVQVALPVVQSVELMGGVTLEVTGVQVDVTELVAKLQAFTQQLTEAGINLNNLGDVGELSAAFTKLGMDPAEAVVKAQSIHTMLEVVKSKLGIDGSGADSAMALLMMAGLTGAIPEVRQNIEISVSVEQTTVTLVRVQASNALAAAQNRALFGQDVARALAGVGDDFSQLSSGVPAKELKKDLHQPRGAADSLGDAMVEVPEYPAALPDIPVAVFAEGSARTEPSPAKTQSLNLSSVTAVSPEDVIERPTGETLFTWTEQDGVDVIDKTPAHAKAFESLVDAARPEVAVVEVRHVGGSGQASVQGLIHVAEKITYTANHDVVGQVKVHVQQVVDSGGGTVRMQLSPPELGEILIELKISGGEVSGRISANDVTVVQELARDLQSLKQSFADSGLRLAQDGINLMLQNQNQQQQGHGQRQNARSERFADDDSEVAAVDVAAVDNAHWVAPDRILDVKI